MKKLFAAVVFLTTLIQLSVAIQLWDRLARGVEHHRHHGRALPKRDRVTVVDATFEKPTEVPEVVIYVDQYGNAVRTSTETVVILPASSYLVAQSTSALVSLPKVSTSVQGDAAAAKSPVSSGTKSSPTPATGSGNLNGITYSPYKGSGGCKSTSEVDADFALFANNYGTIRIYGVDCNQVANVYQAAKKHGNKLMLGIYDIDEVAQAVPVMAAGVNKDWSIVEMISVGNELINNGGASIPQVIAAIGQARSALRAVGYTGPVTTVDTFVAAINHPELCDASDICTINLHPFFDGNVASGQAGSFVSATITRLRNKLANPNKRIVITESGWPWKGGSHGAAVPSIQNQAEALASIKSAVASPGDLILFTALNDMWKKAEASTYMAEQYWGMGGRSSPCDA